MISAHRLANAVRSTRVLLHSRATSSITKLPKPLKTNQYGIDILHDPLWNKGTAFSMAERDRLGIRGLLPPVAKSLELQRDRVMQHLDSQENDIKRNMYLQDLHSRNETLYFNVLVNNIEKMAPLVYTPTVGLVCQEFGDQFRRSRGMYFSRHDKGEIGAIVHNWPHEDVHVIVVTDGSRILGLGDLGVNGMGIPIGKLALYCAAGGIAPHRVLPITIDVGTNNEKLLGDPQYLGVQEPRLTGDDYFELLDEFMVAVYRRWPNVIVQFEDFETPKAVPLLERYRNKYRCFNDDIQGTGSVTLSGLLSAARNAGTSVKDLRIVCAGAGSAGLGVCQQILDGMVEAGLTHEEAQKNFCVLTSKGALGKADGAKGDPNHSSGRINDLTRPWVNEGVSDGLSLHELIEEFKPNTLLGLSTQKGIFDKEACQLIAAIHDRPIIMPMSNPTSKSECTPQQAYEWTDYRAVVATGSPFDAVEKPDGTVLIPSQCNNMYIFPGIGLAASISGVATITDKMLYLAAEACTNSMNQEEIDAGRTFPHINRIREVATEVALAVIEEAMAIDSCTKFMPWHMAAIEKDGLRKFVEGKMYYPEYTPIVPK